MFKKGIVLLLFVLVLAACGTKEEGKETDIESGKLATNEVHASTKDFPSFEQEEVEILPEENEVEPVEPEPVQVEQVQEEDNHEVVDQQLTLADVKELGDQLLFDLYADIREVRETTETIDDRLIIHEDPQSELFKQAREKTIQKVSGYITDTFITNQLDEYISWFHCHCDVWTTPNLSDDSDIEIGAKVLEQTNDYILLQFKILGSELRGTDSGLYHMEFVKEEGHWKLNKLENKGNVNLTEEDFTTPWLEHIDEVEFMDDNLVRIVYNNGHYFNPENYYDAVTGHVR
jgi:hypothetical protein